MNYAFILLRFRDIVDFSCRNPVLQLVFHLEFWEDPLGTDTLCFFATRPRKL